MKPTLETLRIKIKQAAEILVAIPEVKAGFDDYGAHVEDSKPINEYVADIIWTRLASLGIYQDDSSCELLMSPECSEGEARRLFCEDGDPRIPVIRFKKMWSILKGSAAEPVVSDKSDIERLIESNKAVAEWKDEKLVADYSLDNDVVVDELMKRSKGRPFVAYNATTGEICQEITLGMLRQARKRETPREIKDGGNQLYLLRLANEAPDAVYEECPIHHNVLLTDKYCSTCGEIWNVAQDAKSFVRVMCTEGEGPRSKLEIKAVLQMAREGLAKLTSEFAKIFTVYDRLVKTGTLPSCRRSDGKVMDPMRPGHNSY